ncbi:MAG: VCBS repeat-containing protein [Polyangiales bacterium]
MRQTLLCVVALAACSRPAPRTPPAASPAPPPAAVVTEVDAGSGDASAVAQGLPRCPEGRSPTPRLRPLPEDATEQVWRVRETTAGEGRDAAVVAACARMRDAQSAQLSRAFGDAGDETARAVFAVVGECHYGPSGAWVIEAAGPLQQRTARGDDGPTRWFEQRARLAFVANGGRVTRSTRAAVTLSSRDERGVAMYFTALHDLDGDGADEAAVAVRAERLDLGNPTSVTGVIYAARDGAVAPYARGEGVSATDAFDVDGDGRPDFVQPSRYRAPNGCGPSIFYGPSELAHALPDGGFSRDDAVAREFVRVVCEPLAGLRHVVRGIAEAGEPEGYEYPMRVGCLAFRGVSRETLRAEVESQWSDREDNDCSTREGTLALTAVAAPFTVEPPCE